MKYFRRKSDGEVFGYEPDQEALIAAAQQNSDMEDITGSWPPAEVIKEPTEDDIRAKRNRLLIQSDWTQVADAPVDQAAWAAYRQALRDLPTQSGFPHNVTWPTKPE